MSRLIDLLLDLGTMPGVESAFIFAPEGLLATTSKNDPRDDDRIGRIHSNLVQGAFALGLYLQDLYCDFDNAVIMTRPIGRGCILVARCKPGVSIRLVDISLTMTAKSLEVEVSALAELPPPLHVNSPGGSRPAALEESDFFDNIDDQTDGDFVDEDREREQSDLAEEVDEFATDANRG